MSRPAAPITDEVICPECRLLVEFHQGRVIGTFAVFDDSMFIESDEKTILCPGVQPGGDPCTHVWHMDADGRAS